MRGDAAHVYVITPVPYFSSSSSSYIYCVLYWSVEEKSAICHFLPQTYLVDFLQLHLLSSTPPISCPNDLNLVRSIHEHPVSLIHSRN
jgi:hypothetical protein